jgi:hypothetical protein
MTDTNHRNIGMRGERDDGNVLPGVYLGLPDRRGGFEAIHVRHLYVHQHEVESLGLHRVQNSRTATEDLMVGASGPTMGREAFALRVSAGTRPSLGGLAPGFPLSAFRPPPSGNQGIRTIFPRKRIVPENRSRIANTNGRSTHRHGGRLVTLTPVFVTAAASVPSSFTSTKVLCFTNEM